MNIMHKIYKDHFKGHNFRRGMYRNIAKFFLGLCAVCLLLALCPEAGAAENGEVPLFNDWYDFFWPLLGVGAIIAMILGANKFPCYGYCPDYHGYFDGVPSLHWSDVIAVIPDDERAGVEPSKPWSPEAMSDVPQAWPTPEASPVPSNRATDRKDIPERREHPMCVSEAHKDDLGVLLFSFDMKAKLAICREAKGRHGWYDPEVVTNDQLELGLLFVMRKGDVVDIANYCMFLHQRGIKQISKGVRK